MSADWKDDALCRETGLDDHFPEPGGSSAAAKRTCMACEVRTECLEYAISTGQQWGIWGGVSEKELRKLARSRRQAAA